jgi:hypothetical protein
VFIDDQGDSLDPKPKTYRSGVESANVYATPAPTYHAVRSDEEIAISSADSEVSLLQDVEDQIKNRIAGAATPPHKILVQVYSTYGACDGCKNRLGLFLDRMKEYVPSGCTIRLKYIYDELMTKARDDTSSYGWAGDPKAEFKRGPSRGPKRTDIAGATGQKHVHFMSVTKE